MDPEEVLLRLLPGVGPVIAARMIEAFGPGNARDVLNSKDAVAQLSLVEGLGEETAGVIKEAWDKNSGECWRSFFCCLWLCVISSACCMDSCSCSDVETAEKLGCLAGSYLYVWLMYHCLAQLS
jgi:hypothetical protein